MSLNIETERRFLIEYPDVETLTALPGASKTEITQTYLITSDPASSSRVRKTANSGGVKYFKTIKKRISSSSSFEDEREISSEEYEKELSAKDPLCTPISKTRFRIPHGDHIFEIDVYPFWDSFAVMEVELKNAKEHFSLPPFAAIISEITGKREFSNHSLSRSIPEVQQYVGKTTRIFDIDSGALAFTSKVLVCSDAGHGKCDTVLASSAFFPGGGGQDCDVGKIGGQDVLEVYEKDGVIHHVTAGKQDVGSAVRCEVNSEVRFTRMQNHSGEHILSGIAHTKYGCNNVGFHMGKDDVTLDFDKYLNPDEIIDLEDSANRIIWDNRPIFAYYPEKEDLQNISYRSKIEIDGDVRLVEIEGIDVCACCAPHVKMTGEIGVIRLIDSERYKGGVRIHMLAGRDALKDAREKYTILLESSIALSTNPDKFKNTLDAVIEENAKLKYDIVAVKRRLADKTAKSESDSHAVFVEDWLDTADMRYLTKISLESGALTAAALLPAGSSFKFILQTSCSEYNLKTTAAKITALGWGKCGGSPTMIQGSISCKEEEAREFFKNPDNFR